MIAPSYWVDPKSGNDYMLTVQYPENQVRNAARPARHPAARRSAAPSPTRLDAVTQVTPMQSPTEVDHYQMRRVIDIYVDAGGRGPRHGWPPAIDRIVADDDAARGRARATCAAWCRACARRSAASRSA